MKDKTHDAMAYLIGSWPGEKIPEGSMHDLMYRHTRESTLFGGLLYDTNGPRPYSEELEQQMQQFSYTGIINVDLFKGRSISQGMKERLLASSRLDLTDDEKELLSKTAKDMYASWTARKT
jgi:hypothetical protein